MALLAPIPSASESAAMAVKPGLLRSRRMAWRISLNSMLVGIRRRDRVSSGKLSCAFSRAIFKLFPSQVRVPFLHSYCC